MLQVVSSAIKLMWIIPIKDNQLMFMSFRGQFSDSPKYIYKYITEKTNGLVYVWVSNNDNQGIPSDCKTVLGKGLLFFYNLIRSKVIVTNDFLNTYYPRRPGQIIVNTWHGGSPLKTVGMLGTEVKDDDIDFFKRHDKIYSCFLSSSRFMSEEVFRKSFGYTGDIFEIGMPRNAILFRNHKEVEEKVREHFKIPVEKSIALYAPTFRGNAKEGGFIRKEQRFDIDKCIKALNIRFGKDFVLLFRAHHAFRSVLEGNNVLLASDYPDMQELLCASDVMITDYSSCMGDEALMRKPVFLYCPDLVDYIEERGFYWDIYSLPFPVSTSEEELLNSIKEFDKKAYEIGVEDYLNKLGTFENENADAKAGDIIIDYLKDKTR